MAWKSKMFRNARTAGVTLAAIVAGCAGRGPVNPSFSVTAKEARSALRQMAATPKPLQRPLVILGGWFDPGVAVVNLERKFRRWTGDERVTSVAFPFKSSFEDCRAAVISAVDRAFPNDDPHWTTEVDMVAVSMGGLVGRYAAMACHPTGRSLRIARLFTLATPHRGANLAALPTVNPLQIQMRHGSPFLAGLERPASSVPYQLYSYVRLGDVIVGAPNTAPEGQQPWWIRNLPLEYPHLLVFRDPRILADIARRIRGESPYTTTPPAPFPQEAVKSPH